MVTSFDPSRVCDGVRHRRRVGRSASWGLRSASFAIPDFRFLSTRARSGPAADGTARSRPARSRTRARCASSSRRPRCPRRTGVPGHSVSAERRPSTQRLGQSVSPAARVHRSAAAIRRSLTRRRSTLGQSSLTFDVPVVSARRRDGKPLVGSREFRTRSRSATTRRDSRTRSCRHGRCTRGSGRSTASGSSVSCTSRTTSTAIRRTTRAR